MDENINFFKGPHCKVQTQIQWKFFGRTGKKTFFEIKQKVQS